MIRLVLIVVVACAIFGVGKVAGFGSTVLGKTQQAIDVGSAASCEKPNHVVSISFSKTKYAHVRRHALDAERHGWPRVLTINREGAGARRDRLLEDVPTKDGYDRDEYPPAVGRSSWRADVAYVPSAENRSHGASMGAKLRRFCDGTKFKYVFY